MNYQRSGLLYLAFSLFWAGFGLIWYSHGVRAVDFLGLFFSGAAFGGFLTKAIATFRASGRTEL